jgi:hypothetical protein
MPVLRVAVWGEWLEMREKPGLKDGARHENQESTVHTNLTKDATLTAIFPPVQVGQAYGSTLEGDFPARSFPQHVGDGSHFSTGGGGHGGDNVGNAGVGEDVGDQQHGQDG